MKVVHHRLIQKDVRIALSYFEEEGGPRLADKFMAEADAAVEKVMRNPKGFHFIADGLRRAPFKSFPYHFIYEEDDKQVRFLVLRHDKRHPSFGLKRQ